MKNIMERVCSVKGQKAISYPESYLDWKECWKWYRSHKMVGQKFDVWYEWLSMASDKDLCRIWETYALTSMEEIAFRTKYTKYEILGINPLSML